MTEFLNIEVTETGAPEPVTLDEVKDWLQIDFDDNDALLTSMIKGARQDIENRTNLALISKTVTALFDVPGETDFMRLPYGVASSIVVKTIEDDETLSSALTAGSDYYTRVGNRYVIPGSTGRYQVGYTVGNTVPEALKEAIKMLVGYRYKNRGDQEAQKGFPEDVQEKINPYVEVWL